MSDLSNYELEINQAIEQIMAMFPEADQDLVKKAVTDAASLCGENAYDILIEQAVTLYMDLVECNESNSNNLQSNLATFSDVSLEEADTVVDAEPHSDLSLWTDQADFMQVAPTSQADSMLVAPTSQADSMLVAPTSQADSMLVAPTSQADQADSMQVAPTSQADSMLVAPTSQADSMLVAPTSQADQADSMQVAPTSQADSMQVAPTSQADSMQVAPTSQADSMLVAPTSQADQADSMLVALTSQTETRVTLEAIESDDQEDESNEMNMSIVVKQLNTNCNQKVCATTQSCSLSPHKSSHFDTVSKHLSLNVPCHVLNSNSSDEAASPSISNTSAPPSSQDRDLPVFATPSSDNLDLTTEDLHSLVSLLLQSHDADKHSTCNKTCQGSKIASTPLVLNSGVASSPLTSHTSANGNLVGCTSSDEDNIDVLFDNPAGDNDVTGNMPDPAGDNDGTFSLTSRSPSPASETTDDNLLVKVASLQSETIQVSLSQLPVNSSPISDNASPQTGNSSPHTDNLSSTSQLPTSSESLLTDTSHPAHNTQPPETQTSPATLASTSPALDLDIAGYIQAEPAETMDTREILSSLSREVTLQERPLFQTKSIFPGNKHIKSFIQNISKSHSDTDLVNQGFNNVANSFNNLLLKVDDQTGASMLGQASGTCPVVMPVMVPPSDAVHFFSNFPTLDSHPSGSGIKIKDGKRTGGNIEATTVIKKAKFEPSTAYRHPAEDMRDEVSDGGSLLAFLEESRETQDNVAAIIVECNVCSTFHPMAKCATCTGDHQVCKSCIEDEVRVVMLDKQKLHVSCPVPFCKESVGLEYLESVLDSFVIGLLKCRIQQNENEVSAQVIKKMSGLVSCPKCTFTALLDEEELHFTCGNKNCYINICWYCKGDWTSRQHHYACLLLNFAGSECLEDFSKLPANWETNHFTGNLKMVELDHNSLEALRLMTYFYKTSNCTIIKVWRVQNKKLWEKYILKRKHMKEELGVENINEKVLFHGTHEKNVKVICNDGFDMRVKTVNGAAFGKGVYFSSNAEYSEKYSINGKTMIIARVLCGKSTVGGPDLTRPPADQAGRLFDTCVDQGPTPFIYTVFDNSQCYPAALVQYN